AWHGAPLNINAVVNTNNARIAVANRESRPVSRLGRSRSEGNGMVRTCTSRLPEPGKEGGLPQIRRFRRRDPAAPADADKHPGKQGGQLGFVDFAAEGT